MLNIIQCVVSSFDCHRVISLFVQALVDAKRKAKADSVFRALSELPPNCRIRIKASSGVFECPLLSFDRDTETVEVLWIDGVRKTQKWSTIVWGVVAVQADTTPQPVSGMLSVRVYCQVAKYTRMHSRCTYFSG